MQHKLWQQQRQQRQHLKSCVNHRQSGNILVLYVCPSQSECVSVRVCVYLLVWVRETAEQQNAKRKCRQYPIGNRWKFIENCAQIKFYVCLLFHLRRRHAVISPPLTPHSLLLFCSFGSCLARFLGLLKCIFLTAARQSAFFSSRIKQNVLHCSNCCFALRQLAATPPFVTPTHVVASTSKHTHTHRRCKLLMLMFTIVVFHFS